MIKEVTGLIYISVRPNLLRPFNACGMVQRNSLTIGEHYNLSINEWRSDGLAAHQRPTACRRIAAYGMLFKQSYLEQTKRQGLKKWRDSYTSAFGRIYCGRLTRVEWSRGTLQSLLDRNFIICISCQANSRVWKQPEELFRPCSIEVVL